MTNCKKGRSENFLWLSLNTEVDAETSKFFQVCDWLWGKGVIVSVPYLGEEEL
jgi:hypothetical protein